MGNTVLILEDDKGTGRLYEKHLKTNGYNPILVSNGCDGLDLLKKIKPDLILLDLVMPKMNGIEFYQYICGLDGRSRYPVLIVTAHLELIEVFKDFYVDGILLKPMETPQLLGEITRIFYNRYWSNQRAYTKKIAIIDDNTAFSKKLSGIFSDVGYITEVLNSGISGVESISIDPPDLAIVSLGMTDLPGDMVIVKLQEMERTAHTQYILYAHKNQKHNKTVMDKFAQKSGVKLMYEYSRPIEFLDVAIQMFRMDAKA